MHVSSTRHSMSDWKSRFAVLGVAASAVLAAKALRQLWLFAELGVLDPPVRKFKGEWALVTGGSEGVGKAIAAQLAKHGLNVLLVSRSQAKLDTAAAEIRSKHGSVQVRTYATDLTQQHGLDGLLQHLAASNTPVSVLVANAGGAVSRFASYWDFSEQEDAVIQALNGTACYMLVKRLLPGMVQRGKGAIVAVSSLAHRMGAYIAPYAAEKAKINALCSALHHELRGSGVTAQAMVLGAVITPGLASMLAPSKPAAAGAAAAAGAVGGDGNSSTGDAAAASVAVAPQSPFANTTSSSSRSSSSDVAAAMASIKPTVMMPSAETAAAAIVCRIGRGGPVVTPYWGHSLSEAVLLNAWWPPELRRCIEGSIARSVKSSHDARLAAAQPA